MRHRRPCRRWWCRNVPHGLADLQVCRDVQQDGAAQLGHHHHWDSGTAFTGMALFLIRDSNVGFFYCWIQQPLQLAACHSLRPAAGWNQTEGTGYAEFTAIMFLFICQKEWDISTGTGCPEMWWMPYPWKLPQQGCTTWCQCSLQGSWTRWPLKVLSSSKGSMILC